jgi:hypothetical protein
LLPNLTKNVATRAAQRKLLPKLTNILQYFGELRCESCLEKKHGAISGKTKAAKTADGTNAFSSY